MSGGVDSSVAAALLAEAGHDVIGVSMQLYDQSNGQTSFGSCCTLDDLYDARRVAAAIDIPHYILNFEKQFDENGNPSAALMAANEDRRRNWRILQEMAGIELEAPAKAATAPAAAASPN